MITQTNEYALRAIVCLAAHGKPLITQRIAELTKAPAGYLSKVLQLLHRAGLVESQRGLNGGFWLARPAKEITIIDVINAVDPLAKINHCPLGLESHSGELCSLHRKIADAIEHVEKAFASHTIADLVKDTTPRAPLGGLCELDKE